MSRPSNCWMEGFFFNCGVLEEDGLRCTQVDLASFFLYFFLSFFLIPRSHIQDSYPRLGVFDCSLLEQSKLYKVLEIQGLIWFPNCYRSVFSVLTTEFSSLSLSLSVGEGKACDTGTSVHLRSSKHFNDPSYPSRPKKAIHR